MMKKLYIAHKIYPRTNNVKLWHSSVTLTLKLNPLNNTNNFGLHTKYTLYQRAMVALNCSPETIVISDYRNNFANKLVNKSSLKSTCLTLVINLSTLIVFFFFIVK
jgi:hypothetical protein